jgi:hypothetical protein
MRTIHYIATITLFAGITKAFFACTPSNTMPPEPDVVIVTSDAGPRPPLVVGDAAPSCMLACERLHEIPCSEGADAGACAQKCAQNMLQNMSPFDLQCITQATTKEAARACDGIGPKGCQ